MHYDTCKEVAELGYTVQDSYCCGVPRQVTAMHKTLENQLLSIVLAEFTASHSCCLTSENTGFSAPENPVMPFLALWLSHFATCYQDSQ